MRKLTSAAAVALALAAVAAVSAAPAAAGHEHEAPNLICSPLPATAGADTFSGLGFLARSAGRSENAKEPDQPTVETTIPAGSEPTVPEDFTAEIPVYFHVINEGTSRADGNVPLKTIKEQIDVLNLTFAGYYGGYDTGFSFELVSVDRTTNEAWFNMEYGSREEKAAKTALRKGGANALNIYSATAGAYLGWATWPWMYEEQPELDGIVIDFESMPGGAYGTEYGLGYTATHEVGHWVGLYHTFNTSCGGEGDLVADTPEQSSPTSGCPYGKDTCTQHEGLDPIHNYMDYSYDSCYTEFTPDQHDRAAKHWIYYRE